MHTCCCLVSLLLHGLLRSKFFAAAAAAAQQRSSSSNTGEDTLDSTPQEKAVAAAISTDGISLCVSAQQQQQQHRKTAVAARQQLQQQQQRGLVEASSTMRLVQVAAGFRAAAVLLLLQQQHNVSAFEAAAHEAISMTALSGLTMQSNQALRRLLNGKDVADVSGWAHRVTEKYPLTAPLHFQRQPSCPSPPPLAANTQIERSVCSSSDAERDGCLLEALTYFFYRLTEPEKNAEVRDDDNPVINTSEFVFPHGIVTTDADAVKYVINLIGDMHEPLHWGSSDDDFGRTIQVEYEIGDETREIRRTSLYEFIEGAFVQKIMQERQSFWYSGWTHVNSVKAFYEEEKAVFGARKESYFLAWARENRAILCSEIYPVLSRMAKKKGETNVYVLDRTTEFLFFEIIKKRILVAGARVAVVMNYILQVRNLDEGLGQLRAGSGMQDVQETVDTKVPSSGDAYVYLRNFLINLSIFLLVILFFIYISRFYRSTPSPTPLNSRSAKAADETEMLEAKAN